MSDQQQFRKSWFPTRKWWVGLVTSAAALGGTILQADHWSKSFNVAILTVVTGAITSYLIPNNENPGGYTTKTVAEQSPVLAGN